ncbi:MAG: hypothetical protein KIS66_17310 [Fimbriimonadaceae bacterium]|nr:hypothetical protein [Fimbriimonadaceae bacterium]
MNKTLLTILAVGLASGALGQVSLETVSKAMADAKSLRVEYVVTELGGLSAEYRVTLAKPNLATIDSPDKLVVADGKTVTTFDKKERTFFRRAQTDADLTTLLAGDETRVWSPFFGQKLGMTGRNLGTKNRRGMVLDVLEVPLDAQGKKIATLYVLASDRLPRQAEIAVKDPAKPLTYVLNTKSLDLNQVDASAFAFRAPEGSRELTEDEVVAFKWLASIDEAKKIAAATNKLIFVDFYADW